MLERLEEFVANHWSKIDINGNPLSALSLTVGGPHRKKVVHYNATNPDNITAFSEAISQPSKKNCVSICVYNNKTPVAWIKLTSNENYFQITQQEYKNLVYAHDKSSPQLKETIPTPVAIDVSSEHCFYLQRYTTGETMSEQISPLLYFSKRKLTKEFRAIKHWLLDFQAQTQQENPMTTQQLADQRFLTPYRTLIEGAAVSPEEQQFCTLYQQRIDSIGKIKIPTVSSHGDFFALNIIFGNKNQMYVIDWCDFEQESNPFLDLFTFICTFRLPGKNTKENILSSLEYSFLKKNWFANLLKEFVRDYCDSLNCDYELVKVFYPIFLMNRIQREERLSGHIAPQFWREHLTLYIENEEQFWH